MNIYDVIFINVYKPRNGDVFLFAWILYRDFQGLAFENVNRIWGVGGAEGGLSKIEKKMLCG